MSTPISRRDQRSKRAIRAEHFLRQNCELGLPVQCAPTDCAITEIKEKKAKAPAGGGDEDY